MGTWLKRIYLLQITKLLLLSWTTITDCRHTLGLPYCQANHGHATSHPCHCSCLSTLCCPSALVLRLSSQIHPRGSHFWKAGGYDRALHNLFSFLLFVRGGARALVADTHSQNSAKPQLCGKFLLRNKKINKSVSYLHKPIKWHPMSTN